MMQDNIMFWLLICGHLVGDFYLQPQVLAERKKRGVKFLLLHGCIYALAVLIFLLPIMSRRVFLTVIYISLSHLLVDYIKIKLLNSERRYAFIKKNAFCSDQIIHIAIIIVIAYIYATGSVVALNNILGLLLKIYYGLQLNFTPIVFLRFIFVLLLIGKPANILIKEINRKDNIKRIDNENSESDDDEKNCSQYQNAGAIIGTLERMVIVIMLVLKQYAAIGLVFTAKSITRYDKISKDPSFAEYYLVGTLLSVLISIAAIVLIQPI